MQDQNTTEVKPSSATSAVLATRAQYTTLNVGLSSGRFADGHKAGVVAILGVPGPLLHLGDVGLVVERVGGRRRSQAVRSKLRSSPTKSHRVVIPFSRQTRRDLQHPTPLEASIAQCWDRPGDRRRTNCASLSHGLSMPPTL